MSRSGTLVAIPTIDRDVGLAAACFAGLRPLLAGGAELLVITRERDARVRETWPRLWPDATVRTVPDYAIDGRHNCDALADKRNLARSYAAERACETLFFVDSDIRIRPDTFELLYACVQAGADVAFAPYAVRWYGNRPIVGAYDRLAGRFAVSEAPDSGGAVWSGSALGGMGCTLIHRDSFDVPFRTRSVQNADGLIPATGEDIGFFLECIERQKRICYVRHVVEHHVDA